VAATPLVQTEDGERLEPKPSSFKEKRDLQPAKHEDLASLRVDAVFPMECDLPPGLYRTLFTYRDAPLLKDAVLVVNADAAFLLTGTPVDAALRGQADVYSFFDDAEEDRDEDDEDDDGRISFDMLCPPDPDRNP
jgi:hypothetical protein